jgi:hypothetical protein
LLIAGLFILSGYLLLLGSFFTQFDDDRAVSITRAESLLFPVGLGFIAIAGGILKWRPWAPYVAVVLLGIWSVVGVISDIPGRALAFPPVVSAVVVMWFLLPWVRARFGGQVPAK